MLKRAAIWGALAVAVGLLAIQLVPYGRDHTNPSVLAEPSWDSPRTRELAAQACFNCHSNETHWPWYSNIAPISWLTQRDVDEGRDELNFSEWGAGEEAGDIAESVVEGDMPPRFYTTLRFWDRLTTSEKQELIDGLLATFGGERKGRED